MFVHHVVRVYPDHLASSGFPIWTSFTNRVDEGFDRGTNLDSTQRFSYGLKFENAFLRSTGKAFETFFSRIMAHAYPGNFTPVAPYGSKGDLKCDGFRKSDGTVYQCYAPEVLRLAPTLTKIDQDFAGAVAHWGGKMKRWEFVHNEAKGLPAEVVQKLVDLQTANPAIEIAQFGEASLRVVVMDLSVHQLEDLFGAVPSQRTLEKLDFAALKPVITAIKTAQPDAEPPLAAPSPDKLKFNALSMDAAGLLRQGRLRERLVQSFFDAWPDPSLGEDIAEGFRQRYAALRKVGLASDQIFGELQAFAGGMDGDPTHQGAVLAVMSYFFERCDIFEDGIPVGSA